MWLSVVTILVVIVALLKGLDPRFVLCAGGLLLGVLAGHPMSGLDAFANGLTKSGPLESICLTLGLVEIIRETRADHAFVSRMARYTGQHPAKILLVSSSLVFLLNIALPSASGVVAVVGATFIPLMVRSGISAVGAASAILLGTFGSMLSPGFSQIAVLQSLTGATNVELFKLALMPTVTTFIGICCFNCLMETKRLSGNKTDVADIPVEGNVWLAGAPILPIGIYILFYFLSLKINVSYSVLISAIYLTLISKLKTDKVVSCFFWGMGKAFSNVFSITVSALVFATGFQQSGLLEKCFDFLSESNFVGLIFIGLSFLTAIFTGSSDAITLAINQNFVQNAQTFGFEPNQMGLLVAQAAQFGRVISPVAGATLIVASLADVTARQILRRLLVPFSVSTLSLLWFYS